MSYLSISQNRQVPPCAKKTAVVAAAKASPVSLSCTPARLDSDSLPRAIAAVCLFDSLLLILVRCGEVISSMFRWMRIELAIGMGVGVMWRMERESLMLRLS